MDLNGKALFCFQSPLVSELVTRSAQASWRASLLSEQPREVDRFEEPGRNRNTLNLGVCGSMISPKMKEGILVKGSKFSDAQVKQTEDGLLISDLCREFGMSVPSFYKRRSK